MGSNAQFVNDRADRSKHFEECQCVVRRSVRVGEHASVELSHRVDDAGESSAGAGRLDIGQQSGQREPPASGDRCALTGAPVEQSGAIATLMEKMDWSAVALLLAERADLPAVLVAVTGEVLLVAGAAERALGWSYDSVGCDWIARYVLPESASAARWLFHKALSGATRRLDLEIVTGNGPAYATFEAFVVGSQQGRGVLLILQNLAPRPLLSRSHDYDYEVHEDTTGVLTLGRLWGVGSELEPGKGTCHQVLHGRATPCEPCPLRTGGGLPRSVVSLRSKIDYEVTTAARCEADSARIRVSVRRFPLETLSALLQAKLDTLSARAALSLREQDVFRRLVAGRTLDEIAEELAISPRTVKFHQANLLQKLGADSRNDLMRLIL